MGLLDRVDRFIERHALLEGGTTVLVGVSGGVDSMVCLSVLRRLDYDVHGLHANYGLRREADAEEALVRQWCGEQSPPVPFTVVSLNATQRAETQDESLQEAARELRYGALADRAAVIDASAVATGHHRDDQAETLLLNLVRGAGPEGLAGMRPSRPLGENGSIPLVRPLLGVPKSRLKDYAEAEGLPWRTDPTNRSLDYDRGVIRTEILPRLASHFEGVEASIARSGTLMSEYVDQALRPALEQRMRRAYSDCEKGGWLSLDVLRDDPPVWRRRLLLEGLDRTLPDAPQTYALADELCTLVDSQVGRRVEVGGGTIWRERGGLRFIPEPARSKPLPPTPVPWNTEIELPHGTLSVEHQTETPETLKTGTSYVEYADADRLGDGLHVRSWKDGDRFHPLGLDGSKLVSDLLTEAKVPPHRRAAACVLCTDDHIAWLIGHRLDHRVRVRPDTSRVARLILRPREKPSDGCQSS